MKVPVKLKSFSETFKQCPGFAFLEIVQQEVAFYWKAIDNRRKKEKGNVRETPGEAQE